jgi:signal transduction histidine kinase
MATGGAFLGLKGFIEAARRLPSAVMDSLNPATEADATIVESQLDVVQTSLRRLNWVLPVTGLAVLLTVHNYGIALMPMSAFFAVLALSCVLNDYFLTREGPPGEDAMARARRRAQSVSASAVMLVSVWCFTVLSMYHSEITANRIFIVLVLGCTVGSLSTMFAMHAASAAGSLAVMASSLLAILIRNSFSGRLTLLPIGIIYVIFVVNQVRGMHARFTHSRRLEQERETLIQSLQQANRDSQAAQEHAMTANKAKSEFLANMSHELRTPLNAIIGFSEVMRDQMFGPMGDTRYGDYSRLIHNAGMHLLGLINDVLDMSKIEAGKLELHPETFDLRLPVNEAIELMRERATAANLQFISLIPDGPLPLVADRRAVHQIVLNLLSNAVKFSLAGGEIRIRAGRRGPSVWFAVEDKGMGIPASELPGLGQPFVQVRNQAGLVQGGTGLGLALVRALTEKHQGSMKIESVEGAGTTVTIELPANAAVAAAA